MVEFIFVENTFMVSYTKEAAEYCDPFSCGDDDLDDFFSHDVFLYEKELLGKTYCWINKENQHEIYLCHCRQWKDKNQNGKHYLLHLS